MNWQKIAAKAIALPAAIFIVNFFLTYVVGIYGIFPWFDIVMHFSGGFSIAFSTWLVLRDSGLMRKFKDPQGIWLKGLIMLGTTMIIAVAWEWYEFALDKFFLFHIQISVADTMGDLLMGFLGAVGAIILFVKRNK